MTALTPSQISADEYLAHEQTSDQRHEFYAGLVIAQAGGSALHNRITMNTLNSLYLQLQQRPCHVYGSDMRVNVPLKQSYVYPDVTVVCGDEQFADANQDILLNPVVIIEVLSPSTERHDRGRKFEIYRSIATLQEYLLIAQDTRRIDHFVRQSEKLWMFSSISAEEGELWLPSIQCMLHFEHVYRDA
ncbi:MAG: Uma2 family endonuclease [Candidatus Viridilinea halotolerans]|uniref:Uma2 family endonuclease n=1 Tax=Candidatus Viridilinea halotolerans TaxID=2491704 RepID=A0A426UCX5_9CHLR|nr:MAG: Uma2 family endonuclease [Candidatus Viridilinea halotolerans]